MSTHSALSVANETALDREAKEREHHRKENVRDLAHATIKLGIVVVSIILILVNGN